MKVVNNGLTIEISGALGHFPKEFVVSALEKQMPKKVIEQTENDREFLDYVCPNCKTTLQQKNKQAKRITIYKYKHCIDCGQALDWSDTECPIEIG